jgi:hypothetical protein
VALAPSAPPAPPPLPPAPAPDLGPPLGVLFDGAGGAQVASVGFAADGALYVGGNFRERLTAGRRVIKSGSRDPGYQQMFVARIDRDGTVGFLVRVGGADPAELSGMAVAPDGTVAVVGGYDHVIGRDHGPAAHTLHEGTLIAIAPDGKVRWERKIPSADRAWATHAAFDRTGAIYISGGFAAETTFGDHKLTSTSGRYVPSVDAFLARYTADGKVAWIATGGGAEDDGATALAVLPSGDVAIAGYIGAASTFGGLALAGPRVVTKLANPTRGFVAVYRATGEVRGASEFGTHETMRVNLLAAGSDGSFTVAGDDEQALPPRAEHPFVARFDADARLIAQRDVDTVAAASPVDGAVVAVTVNNDRVVFERHDGARTQEVAAFTRTAMTRLEPITLARASDGRVAFAAVVGDFIERPLGGGRVEVSSDAIDSVVAVGALDALGAVAALR